VNLAAKLLIVRAFTTLAFATLDVWLWRRIYIFTMQMRVLGAIRAEFTDTRKKRKDVLLD